MSHGHELAGARCCGGTEREKLAARALGNLLKEIYEMLQDLQVSAVESKAPISISDLLSKAAPSSGAGGDPELEAESSGRQTAVSHILSVAASLLQESMEP